MRTSPVSARGRRTGRPDREGSPIHRPAVARSGRAEEAREYSAQCAVSDSAPETGLRRGCAQAGKFVPNFLQAVGRQAQRSFRGNAKRFHLGVNVLAVPGKILGDVHELNCDDPANAAGRRHRYQDGHSDRRHAADAQSFEERDHRAQNERQNEGKCQGDQNRSRAKYSTAIAKQRDHRPLIGVGEVVVRCADPEARRPPVCDRNGCFRSYRRFFWRVSPPPRQGRL
jgi:hypothetical protein